VSRVPAMMGRVAGVNPLYFDDVQEHKQVDALLDGNFKLICLADGGYELFDVSRDGDEIDNIAADFPETVDKMYAEVLMARSLNKERKTRNIAKIETEFNQLSEEDRKRITRQLKSLGYIR
jgi:hypothetical protein